MILNHSRSVVLMTSLVLLLSGGCRRETSIAPPELHLGEDLCEVCHMIISDGRYAAGLVTLDDAVRNVSLAFDDIGCALNFEKGNPDRPIKAHYVRDYETEQWLDAEIAHFLQNDRLHTPMGFGLTATAERASVERLHEQHGGEIINLDEARQRFREGSL